MVWCVKELQLVVVDVQVFELWVGVVGVVIEEVLVVWFVFVWGGFQQYVWLGQVYFWQLYVVVQQGLYVYVDFDVVGCGYVWLFCLIGIGEGDCIGVDCVGVVEVDIQVFDVQYMVGMCLYCVFDWFFELVLVL